MRKLSLVLVCAFLWLIGSSQNEVDVLRMSFNNGYSTARSTAMGGAFGALGADFSALTNNPAGLGLYRKGEFSFTPAMGIGRAQTDFNSNTVKSSESSFKFNSLGYVSTSESLSENVSKVVFGMGYNRISTFNEKFKIEGYNDFSLLDVFVSQAQNTDGGIPSGEIFDRLPFSAGMAWEAYLIDNVIGSDTEYVSAIPYGRSKHDIEIERKGGVGEFAFGIGTNVSDRFYWGVSAAVPIVNYEQKYFHTENPEEEDLDLNSFTWEESLNVSGSGFNAKLGIIMRPNDFVRLGAAIHTPTIYALTDSFSTQAFARFKGEPVISPEQSAGVFSYRVRTPGKVQLNSAFILGKIGVLSADYEYKDYSKGKLKNSNNFIESDYDFATENAVVNDIYQAASSISVGAEFRVQKVLRVRAGYKSQQSPFETGVASPEVSAPLRTISGGVGYRKKAFFTDLAVSFSNRNSSYYAYSPSLINAAETETQNTIYSLTIGWRFE